jgi:hypothetical protein
MLFSLSKINKQAHRRTDRDNMTALSAEDTAQIEARPAVAQS